MENWFIDFIKSYENFSPTPYKDKGRWVIGYGTKYLSDGTEVTEQTPAITKEEGEKALRRHLLELMKSIPKYFPKFNLFPTQVLYGLLNMGYRGGPDYFANSPKFTKAINTAWDDNKLTKDEYQNILKEMNFTDTGNLLDRNERMAAMLGNMYNPADSISINYATSYDTPYKNWHTRYKQGGTMNYLDFYKSGGGIHIKKENKGKFTSYCGGKVTEECIQRGKHSSNPTTRKRANFAWVARHKFRHQDGGVINYFAPGGYFYNSVKITPDELKEETEIFNLIPKTSNSIVTNNTKWIPDYSRWDFLRKPVYQNSTTPFKSTSGVRADRNNNPGNIRHNSDTFNGEVKSEDPAFKAFATMGYGYRALFKNINTYITKHNANTLASIISRWAPPTENNTAGYISKVINLTGMGANDIIDPKNKNLMTKLAYAIATIEALHAPDNKDIEEGWKLYSD